MGLVQHQAMLAVVLVVGGLGVAAFHPPGAMVAHTAGRSRPGTAMSVFVTSGVDRLRAVATAGRQRRGTLRARVDGLVSAARACLRAAVRAGRAGAAARAASPARRRPACPAAAGAQPLPAVPARGAANGGVAVVRDVRAGAADAAGHERRRGRHGDGALPVHVRASAGSGAGGCRISFGPRRVIVWSLLLATPFLFAGAADRRAGRSPCCCRSAACSCSRRCRSTSASVRRWRRTARPRCRR